MTAVARAAVLAAVLGVVGCSKSAAPPARDWSLHPALFTMTGASDIAALGDLHGDIAAAARILSAAGLITPSTPYQWTGGTRVLVVTGDVIDKGSTALPIIDLLIVLEEQARAAGGQVVVTLGNHEAEFLADPTDAKSQEFQLELQSRGLDPREVAAGDSKYGSWLLARPLAALVDGWFFSHAGNSAGESAAVLGRRFQDLVDAPEPKGSRSRFDDPFLVGANSLLEQQLWWQLTGSSPTAIIDATLEALPAQHSVFGHDPGAIAFPDDPQGERPRGELVARYQGRIFLIDVGASSAVGYSEGALLRIVRGATDQATAILADGTSHAVWP